MTNAQALPTSDQLVRLPLEWLAPAPDNPRTLPGPMGELVASIQSLGILEPLLVTPLGPKSYRIVCGERRWRAAREAGLAVVPCIVREMSEKERQAAMLVENLHRRSLDPLDEARALARLEKLGWTQREIAQKIGKSQAYVSRRLLLLELPADQQRMVARGKVNMNRALGYDYSDRAPLDVFEADEDLQESWRALRQEVIDYGDRHLMQLLRDFALSWKSYRSAHKQGATA